jgi:hypothetical protein
MSGNQCSADTREAVAFELWQRFAPVHHIGWADETHKAEYYAAADGVLAVLPAPAQAVAVTPAAPVGMDWTLSDEAKQQIDEINRNIREAPANVVRLSAGALDYLDTLSGARKEAMESHASMLPQCSAASASDRQLAEQLWAKLCTDCAHVGAPEKCDCLDDILEALAAIRAVPQTVWMPIETAPKGPAISVARKGGQRDDGSTYWYQAVGHYDPNLGHFHKSYGELYGEPEVWARYPENPEHCPPVTRPQRVPQ